MIGGPFNENGVDDVQFSCTFVLNAGFTIQINTRYNIDQMLLQYQTHLYLDFFSVQMTSTYQM